MYAVPDKTKKKKPPEEEEGDNHRPDPNNQPKSKGFIVNKKAKAKKEPLEDIELVSHFQIYCWEHFIDLVIPQYAETGIWQIWRSRSSLG